MKTLFSSFVIALGVAAVLYAKVNLGMSWQEMSYAVESVIPRILAVGVILGGTLAALLYINRSGRPE